MTAAPHRSPPLPRRLVLGAGWVAAAGAALAALVVAALAALAWYERLEAIDAWRDRTELIARVLEDHSSRSLDSASLALSALAEVLAKQPAGRDPQIGDALTQALAGLPLLRAVVVLDEHGQVLASTGAADAGVHIDMAKLGPPPAPGRDRLGSFVAGRGIDALQPPPRPAPAGVGFMPLWRELRTSDGHPRWLLGLLNPDALANQQAQTLDTPVAAAALVHLNGSVQAATANASAGPGGHLTQVPVLTRYLGQADHGSYLGNGMRPSQMVAYRALRTRPLVVMVEVPLETVYATWWINARWLAAVGLVATLFIASMTVVATRSVRSRERASQQRDVAQWEVTQRERELSVIVKSVQELIFRTDAQGRLTFVNARWQAACNLATDQLLGRHLADTVQPHSRDAVLALFAAHEEGTRATHALIGDQQPRHFDIALAPLVEGERVVGFAGSAVDITDRWVAEAQLRAQLAISRLVLETMPLPVSMFDRDRRYLSVNRAWQDFTGLSAEEVIGTQVQRRLPPEEQAIHDQQDERLLREGGRVRYEAETCHPDGSRRTLAITKAAVPGPDGQPNAVLVAFMDVSEFREAERATREARDAAEETSRAKSEFIANISHELRTPLQSIIGFSELGMLRGRAHEKLVAMFSDIHASGQRMLALVNDLLDVSKIESTVGTFHLERTDVRPLVREVVRELEPLLHPRRLRVDLRMDDGPLVAKIDPLRYQQVVRNVLANAVKFSPNGSAIEVAGGLSANQQVVIGVRDRGPGIPLGELESIFEAFVQSSQTKDGSGGTGLGLAICRKIIDAHGGRITAENVPGGGSRFVISVPARGFADTTT